LRGLYAVTPDDPDTARLVAHVTAAVRGGAAIVQYRNKAAPPPLRERQAAALAQACRAHGALFVVNDDARIARDVGADGVHVGEDDGELAAARARVGAGIVGVSCYNDLARAQRAAEAGADYVAFGSFFASTVKPNARRAGLDLLASAGPLGLPRVAIGGITLDNAPALVEAGADALAVISAVFASGDPAQIERAARGFAALFVVPCRP